MVYARYTLGGIYTMVHPPGYTSHTHGEPGHGTRQSRRDRLTALRRVVTELPISDEPLTVPPPVSLLGFPSTRFTVGQLLIQSLGESPREGGMLRRVVPSLPVPVSLLVDVS